MTASRPVIATTTPQAKTSATGNRARCVWTVGLVALVAMMAATWLFLRVRAELADRADAQIARQLIADGKYKEAGAPLERWLKARPDAAEAHFLAARGAIGL